jgi:hypothetical protein
MLLILIPTAWLAVTTMVVCLCRMAAMGDAERPGGVRRVRALRVEVFELERAPIATLAQRRLRAHSDHRSPRATAHARLLAIRSSR